MALVIDASAVIHVLLGTTVSSHSMAHRLESEASHAPHLIDAEVGHVLRRRVLRGELPALEAEALLVAATGLVDYRYEMTGALARAAWTLRENLSFYDALYAALAQSLTCPLLTADARLFRATAIPCVVELIDQA